MKTDFRSQARHLPVTPADHVQATRRLAGCLETFFTKSKNLKAGSYRALPSELHVEHGLFPHIQWAFPRLEGEDLRYSIPGPKGFVTSDFRFQEPDPEGAETVEIQDLDFVLVPGVAFSIRGDRMGRGRGHFDRTLQNYSGLKIGMAKEDRIYREIPTEVHDVPMHAVVTPVGVLHFSGGNKWRQ